MKKSLIVVLTLLLAVGALTLVPAAAWAETAGDYVSDLCVVRSQVDELDDTLNSIMLLCMDELEDEGSFAALRLDYFPGSESWEGIVFDRQLEADRESEVSVEVRVGSLPKEEFAGWWEIGLEHGASFVIDGRLAEELLARIEEEGSLIYRIDGWRVLRVEVGERFGSAVDEFYARILASAVRPDL